MENLNKENFWNDLHKKYPEAVNHFCQWIDNYKKEVGWDNLFNTIDIEDKRVGQPAFTVKRDAPKFHDLPFEMQHGILLRFNLEVYNSITDASKEDYEKTVEIRKIAIVHMFVNLQKNIDNKSIVLN